MDARHNVHASHDTAEGGKALAVGVAAAAEVELRLGTDADEELTGRRVRAVAGHGHRAVEVFQPRDRGPFERDGIVGGPGPVGAPLNHLDLDQVVGLVVRPHRAIERRAVEEVFVDVAQEVGRGPRRPRRRVRFQSRRARSRPAREEATPAAPPRAWRRRAARRRRATDGMTESACVDEYRSGRQNGARPEPAACSPSPEARGLRHTGSDARLRPHCDHRRRVHGGTGPRLHHAAPRAVADRRLPAGRRAGRAAHAGLRRRRRAGRTAGRDRRHPADVRRRAAVSLRRAAGGAAASPCRARSRRASSRRCSAPCVALAFGWSWPAGLVFGMALSVASTVVLVRVLADNRDLHTPTGHIAVGWLVVEDLFTVLVLVLLPALFGARAASGSALALSLGPDGAQDRRPGRVHRSGRHPRRFRGCSIAWPRRDRASCSR